MRKYDRAIQAAGSFGTRCVMAGLAVAAIAIVPGAVAGQEEPERIPTIPAGTPAVFFPVQSARPTAGGAWPGGTTGERDALATLNAELAFALREEEGARDWALPEDVTARLARNPMIRVDPARLAYHGLLREPEPTQQIYEPLHSQLRQVAALFNARIVVLPLAVWYRFPDADAHAAARAASSDTTGTAAPQGRAVVLVAVIDIRRSAVLWHGEIEGLPAEATSGAVLATLAQEVAFHLTPG